MRIAIVSGSWPPDPCGVGDYAGQLAGALRDLGVDVTRLGGEPWSGFRALRELRRAAKARRFDLVHIQYPTMGFGRSLVPALIPLLIRATPVAVTLHEFSSFRLARRLWFVTFAHRVDLRIFTSREESARFRHRMKPSRGQDLVVPIGSNIPACANATERQEKTICCFGLLCPGKGIEDFLDLAALARGKDWRFVLIGAVTGTYAAYANAVVERARSLDVAIHLDEPADEVARLLSSMEIAYLPFPDGACDTRGSLHAVMRNGAVVVTRHAERTSEAIVGASVHASGAAEARDKIGTLLGDDRLRETIRTAGRAVPPRWRDIAEAHVAGFGSMIPRRAGKTNNSGVRHAESWGDA